MNYYVDVEPGVSLYVEDTGVGQPVLFVHGYPLDHRMYEYQVNQLPKYGYRCIQLDLRGFGKSDSPWESYSLDRMADDVRYIIDTLGFKEITLAAFSMGGAVAVRYMGRHAGHGVSKLLLFAAAAPYITKQPGFPQGMLVEGLDALIALANRDRPQMLQEFGKLFFHNEPTAAFRQWFDSVQLDQSPRAITACGHTLRDENVLADLKRIKVPTYIFHGVYDRICPFELAIIMKDTIPNSVLLRFDNSGHAIFYEELDLFNACLLEALKH
ncbi:alpha/beta hydrolase [Paenibacillus lupini]|uniref:alpha/beta fold hydrolase n=1 Tax=Paenibacillus lupini TaxID=1450204 RepID=UPI001421BD5A|nr:alpha/beta hydrolase [Paenibacillus lupini]NIK22980.1 pimeloyl-ACP methyl ester carboxylesterase [Paenibacillus lupini]